MIAAFPLQWPSGWPRSRGHKAARFKSGRNLPSVYEGSMRVLRELEMMNVGRDDVVISTNVRTRLDGLPRANEPEPADSGVAVYWEKGDARRVMAIDIYPTVAANLCAIAATLDAMRSIDRHGGATILDRAFQGFTALPSPGQTSRTWRDVFGFHPATKVTYDDLRAAFRKLANERHPDKPGGSHDAMSELNLALAQAESELA